FDHAPGTGHDDKFEIAHQGYRLLKSACFQKSGGRLTCTTCHNPHDAPRGDEAARRYVAACEGCHAESLTKLAAAGRHTGSRECLPCHMPKRRTEDAVHAVMTDHGIERRKPDRDLLAALAERHEDAASAYRGPVVLYYGAEPPRPDRELYEAVAQVKDGSNPEGGLPRLREALERLRPEQAEPYLALGDGLRAAGAVAPAAAAYGDA